MRKGFVSERDLNPRASDLWLSCWLKLRDE